MSVVSAVSLANAGFSEIRGKHFQYSKFWNANAQDFSVTNKISLSSRNGMILLYTPAFLAGLVSFSLFPDEGLRFFFVESALTIHFFKRIFEVYSLSHTLTQLHISKKLRVVYFWSITFLYLY